MSYWLGLTLSCLFRCRNFNRALKVKTIGVLLITSPITKTCLYSIQRIFSEAKIENFIGKMLILFLFMLKTLIVGTRKNRLAEVVLTSIRNLCFGSKIKNRCIYRCKPQTYYIKVGF